MIRVVETSRWRNQRSIGRNFGTLNPSARLCVGVLLEKYPVLALVFNAERISPEMPLRGLNPAEPRQVGIGIEEWFRALPNADPPVVHRLFPERMLDRLLPKDGTQPANHVRVGRTAINSPLAHIRGRRERLLPHVFPPKLVQLIQLADYQISRSPIRTETVFRNAEGVLGGEQ